MGGVPAQAAQTLTLGAGITRRLRRQIREAVLTTSTLALDSAKPVGPARVRGAGEGQSHRFF